MDPFSQAALGAVVGQAVGHARLGYRAAAVGALAGALPDIDVLFSLNGDYFDQLVTHRGITHSLLFAPVVGPLLGVLVWAGERRRAAPSGEARRADAPAGRQRRADAPAGRQRRLAAWIAVATLALLSHPLLDYLTPYGTQLLLPFSDARFAVNAMPIIDPLYTLLLMAGLLIAGRLLRDRAGRVALTTLAVSSAYLGYGWWLNIAAEREAVRQLVADGMTDAQVAAFPTILQIHYRRVVARTPQQDRVGFISMWRPCDIHWVAAPRLAVDSPPVQALLATREGRIFHWFTMGWSRYRLGSSDDHAWIRATDLRYGFTSDPNRSIFSASAMLDPVGRIASPVAAGRRTAGDSGALDASGQRLRLLFQDTYGARCTLTR